MDVFYKPDIVSDHLTLDPGESNHCIRVLRYKRGDKIRLIDGKGGLYIAEIGNEDRNACLVKIISENKDDEKLPYELHVAIAPTKSTDRLEWFVEKATEIGVTSITPVICERSERRNLRIDRLEKVAVAAIKQSVNPWKPDIREKVPVNEWILQQQKGTRLIAHCMDRTRTDIRDMPLKDQITIMIGPEGDFTPAELELAVAQGFESVSLGHQRLRTETAGLLACATVHIRSGR